MAEPRPLTDRQRDTLRAIAETLRTEGVPPTLRELATALGIVSLTAVRLHLDALERAGYITRRGLVSRGIRLLREPPPDLGRMSP